MAASFKVPSLVKRSKLGTSFPNLTGVTSQFKKQLGRGTFGSVFQANFAKESTKCKKGVGRQHTTFTSCQNAAFAIVFFFFFSDG